MTSKDEENVNLELSLNEDIEDTSQTRQNLVRVCFYIPKRLKTFSDNLANQDGISTSELFRHALLHGMSFYAERSNKFRVNESLRKRENQNNE